MYTGITIKINPKLIVFYYKILKEAKKNEHIYMHLQT